MSDRRLISVDGAPGAVSVSSDAMLDALTKMVGKLPDQERHEIEAMATARRQAGHLRWLSPVQESRLSDLWRTHVRGDTA